MVTIPASVDVPVTPRFSPIFTFFSTPIPPCVIIDPLSLLVDCVTLFTNKTSLVCKVPANESRSKLPDCVASVLLSILILPRVEIPVTFKSWTWTAPVKDVCGSVAIPLTVNPSADTVPVTSIP